MDTNNQEILTEREVGTWLGLSEPTLFRHRRDGTGPKFIRLSARRVAYRRSAIEEWLTLREHQFLANLACTHDG
jgi:predicted DNA-binding transcriptional regulator AlpA